MSMPSTSKVKFRIGRSQVYQGGIMLLSAIATLPLIFILLYIIRQGFRFINFDFFVKTPPPASNTELGGGVANALLGSVIIVSLGAVMAIPVGVLCGIYLSETKNKLAEWCRLCIDVLQGVPSIIMGIVIYSWLVKPFHSYSALAGSVALAIMMLPIVVKSTEETLKLLPGTLREAGFALGMPYHRVIFRILVPCAFSGILSGIMLSVARIAGETAPLIFTAFGNDFISTNIFKPMHSLPYLIYTFATSPYESWQNLAWGAALILLMFVLLLNISTKLITRKWNVQL
jgi:phosphate transport system permease protein